MAHRESRHLPAGERSLKGGGPSRSLTFSARGSSQSHLLAQIFDASGKQMLHIGLDSDDGDQVYFKEAHPDLAAKGDRRYSLIRSGQGRARHHQRPTARPHTVLRRRADYDAVQDRILGMAERAVEFQSTDESPQNTLPLTKEIARLKTQTFPRRLFTAFASAGRLTSNCKFLPARPRYAEGGARSRKNRRARSSCPRAGQPWSCRREHSRRKCPPGWR